MVGCLVGLGTGTYAYVPWDKVKEEVEKQQKQLAQANPPGATPPKAGAKRVDEKDGYAIWLIGKDEEVICGRRSEIEKAPMGSLHGWGLDWKKTVGESGSEFKLARGPFATLDEAKRAYEAELVPNATRDHGISNYTSAEFRFSTKPTKRHMIDNATRFLK